jgi:hypothetical protein
MNEIPSAVDTGSPLSNLSHKGTTTNVKRLSLNVESRFWRDALVHILKKRTTSPIRRLIELHRFVV